jgi:dihydropyrimidinase
VGSDADFVVLDEQIEVTVSPSTLNTAADYTPYEGMQFRGWPWLTVARGDIVYERGRLAAGAHRGAVVTANAAVRRDEL